MFSVHGLNQRRSSQSSYGRAVKFSSSKSIPSASFDLDTGIFKAPKSGIYLINFNAVSASANSSVQLMVNEKSTSVGTSANRPNTPLGFSTILKLNKSDKVNIDLAPGGALISSSNGAYASHAHFSGVLIKAIE